MEAFVVRVKAVDLFQRLDGDGFHLEPNAGCFGRHVLGLLPSELDLRVACFVDVGFCMWIELVCLS